MKETFSIHYICYVPDNLTIARKRRPFSTAKNIVHNPTYVCPSILYNRLEQKTGRHKKDHWAQFGVEHVNPHARTLACRSTSPSSSR